MAAGPDEPEPRAPSPRLRFGLVVIALACMPLAVLTVRAVWDLATVADPLAAGRPPADWRIDEEQARAAKQQNDADRVAWESLRDAPWTAPAETLSPEKLPLESDYGAIAQSWSQWQAATRLVAVTAEAQQSAQDGSVAGLEKAEEQFETLQDEFRLRGSLGGQRLLDLIEKRRASLRTEIAARRMEGEAERLLAEAQRAIDSGRFDDCLNQCAVLLGERFRSLAENPALHTARLLQKRAQFGKDAESLSQRLSSTTEPEARRDAVWSFLAGYTDRSGFSLEETSRIAEFERELAAAETAMAEASVLATARGEIDRLTREPAADLAEQFRRAAGVRSRWPVEGVDAALAAAARTWLPGAIPLIAVEEPEELREVQTQDGQVVRGFFKEVTGPEGAVVGYERYPTLDQMIHPTSAVGTYKVESLQGPPESSIPRRLAVRYAEARARLLAAPHDRGQWQAFIDTCAQLQRDWDEYRKLPGSSEEPLDFRSPAGQAERLLTSEHWRVAERLLAP